MPLDFITGSFTSSLTLGLIKTVEADTTGAAIDVPDIY